MEVAAFLKGLFVGFFACPPIGPIGLLCVKRTLFRGRIAGLVSVLGASMADGIYCCAAGFGITFISEVLERAHEWIQLAGGLLIAIVGIGIVLSEPPNQEPNSEKKKPVDHFLSAWGRIILLIRDGNVYYISAKGQDFNAQSCGGNIPAKGCLID